MTRQQHEEWVRRLEEFARREPDRYRRRVAMLAGLGYAVTWFLLIAAIALGGSLAYVILRTGFGAAGLLAASLIGLPLAGCLLVLTSALSVHIPVPSGIGLDRRRAPRLFEAIDAICAKLEAPPVHDVLVEMEFTAAVQQFPRLGVFGWHRNALIVGLPMMYALSPEHFGAVVAHELGHLSRRVGKLGAWIYRVERLWERLAVAVETKRPVGSSLFRALLRWYVPRFQAYSFVLRRQEEYEADRLSAEAAGARAAAEALLHTSVAGGFLEDVFWPRIERMAGDAAEPPAGVFGLLAEQLPKAAAMRQSEKWVRRAMLHETDFTDTHPCLAERLGALGRLAHAQSAIVQAWTSAAPPMIEVSAAEHFFGDALGPLSDLVEQGWRAHHQGFWHRRFDEMREARRRLSALDQRVEFGDVTDEQAVERFLLTRRIRGNSDALPQICDLARQFPSHPRIRYLCGEALLEAQDPAGIEHLEAALANDPRLTVDACELIYGHFSELDERDKAAEYLRRAERFIQSLRTAHRERDSIAAGDEFAPHALSGDLVWYLKERLREIELLEEAWLVRKSVHHFTDHPMLVLALQPRKVGMLGRASKESIESQLESKVRSFPHPLNLIRLDTCDPAVAESIRSVEKGRIWRRKPS